MADTYMICTRTSAFRTSFKSYYIFTDVLLTVPKTSRPSPFAASASPVSITEHTKAQTKHVLSTFFQTLEALRGTEGGLLDSTKVLPIPLDRELDISKMLDLFPSEGSRVTGKTATDCNPGDLNSGGILALIQRVYPFHLFGLDSAQAASIESVIRNLTASPLASVVKTEQTTTVHMSSEGSNSTEQYYETPYMFSGARALSKSGASGGCASTELIFQGSVARCQIPDIIVPAQCSPTHTSQSKPLQYSSEQVPPSHFHANGTHALLLTRMMQTHAAGYDVCVVGSKGSGKSLLAEQFAHHLGYEQPQLICCYKDMTSRDLLQRRRCL
jgi:hypothetical protein